MIPEGRIYNVKLRFMPMVAENVAEVYWHDTQKFKRQENGSVIAEFRVDGLNEIAWWILGYGDQVEVLAPKKLRKKIAQVAANVNSINR
ncbi:MAG: WYL domain-containing protein [Sedimentisphaerales bacterium]|nr:WYL domain-containing protein [Sedimentisphaerales bacterium]